MRSRYRISCIHRSDRLNHDRRILGVGGVNPDGSRWKISEEAVIAAIETGRWSFYVSQAGNDIDIVIARSRYGNKYIKTAADRSPHPDLLLALPDCH